MDFHDLVREMKSAFDFLDKLPDTQEYTVDDIDAIDDLRHQAMRLSDMAKASLDEFSGAK